MFGKMAEAGSLQHGLYGHLKVMVYGTDSQSSELPALDVDFVFSALVEVMEP